MDNWFEELTGCAEYGYDSTQQRLLVQGDSRNSSGHGRHCTPEPTGVPAP